MKNNILFILLKIILLLTYSTFFSLTVLSQNCTYIDKSYSNLNINDFIQKIEKNKKVKFYSQENSLPEIKIHFNEDSISILNVLSENLAKSSLYITKIQNNFFVTKVRINSFESNNFFTKKTKIMNQENNNSATKSDLFVNENYDFFLKKLTVGNQKVPKKNKNCKISGYVINSDDGLPITGAIIVIKKTGKAFQSKNSGYFSFSAKQGFMTITVKNFGYEDQDYKLDIYSDGEIKLNLQKKLYALDEVVIKSNEDNKITNNKIGFENISVDDIKEIPTLLGEKDIIKAALYLPGVNNVGEGSSGYNVRGSSADQNMFYLGNIPIYNTSHFFGFFSAFNSDAIKEFNLYKSVLPGRYGGKLSSVFEIIPKTGNLKKFSARGGISPVTGKLLIEGPINKKSSYLIGLRSTYSDWVLNFIKYQNINESKIQFADGIFNFSFFLNPKNNLKFLSYISFDKIKMYPSIKYNYKNIGSELSWNHFFNKNDYLNISIVSSNYTYNETNTEKTTNAYTYNYKTRHNEFKTDLFIKPVYNHKISAGLNTIFYILDRGNFIPANDSSVISPVYLDTEYASESGAYLSDEWNITDKLHLTGTIRMNIYSLLGPYEIYTYDDNQIRTQNNISDTLIFKTGTFIKPSYNPDLRFALSYVYLKNHSVKIGYNRSHQYIFMLNNTIAISPSDSWKLSDYYINPMSVNQISLGFFSNFFKNKINTSVEIYYKNADNIPDFKNGAVLLPPDLTETKILQGNLNAYGAEFMIKKSQGKFNGWINYTYSRTYTQINGPAYELTINNGNIYPSNFDIPHTINCLLNYKFSRRFGVSVNTVYSTGRPVTYPSSAYYINGIQLLNYSKRNEYRLPDYFRIDLSLMMEGNLKSQKKAHSSWSISVYNLTGRKNAYSVFFRQGKNMIQGYKLSIFGSPIVSITYSFKLGNYSN